MVLVIIVVISILAGLIQPAPVSLSMRSSAVIVLRQMLHTRRLTGRLHNNRRHRRRRRPQYRAGMTVHYTALMLVVTLHVGVFDHDRFDSARIRR